jgi:hypothetical protein
MKTKDEVLGRLVERSASYWGISRKEVNDPFLLMLYDVLATEFESLGDDIEAMQSEALMNMADFLLPEAMSLVRPAHAIASAAPVAPMGKLSPFSQFFVQVRTRDQMGKDLLQDVHFTPIVAQQNIYNIKLAYMAHHHRLYKMEKGKVQEALQRSFDDNYLWLGFKVHPNIENLDGLVLYLDVQDAYADMSWVTLFEQSAWFIGETPLQVSKFSPENEKGESIYQEDTSYYQNIYNGFFYVIEQGLAGKALEEHCPEAIASMLENSDKHHCVWIKIKLASGIKAIDMEHLVVRPNAFVAINRRLYYLTQKVENGKTFHMPLGAKDHWMGVQNVADEMGRPLLPISFAKMADQNAQEGYYSVRRGKVARIDKDDAKSSLLKLTKVLQEELIAYKSLKQEFLAPFIGKIGEDIDILAEKVKLFDFDPGDEKHFLYIRPYPDSRFVDATYWGSTGAYANSIPRNALLQEYNGTYMKPDAVMFITEVKYGKNPLDSADKRDLLRYAITSRDRIVSKSDLKGFVMHKFGDFIKDVDIRKGMFISDSPKEGYVRCVELVVVTNGRNDVNWPLMKLQIEQAIAEKSAIDQRVIVRIEKGG